MALNSLEVINLVSVRVLKRRNVTKATKSITPLLHRKWRQKKEERKRDERDKEKGKERRERQRERREEGRNSGASGVN